MTDTQEPLGYDFYFECMTAAKSRRALPATEEEIGEGFETVIKSDCGKRKVIL